MKQLVKEFDKKYLGGLVRHLWWRIHASVYIPFKTARITKLPSSIRKDFSLLSRLQFFQRAQYYLQVNRIDGVYAEFGSHEVNTFRMALRTLGLPGKPNFISRFYAFDSFEGMPEPESIDKQKIWRKNMNYTSEKKFKSIVKRDLHRVKTVKGFYEKSLPNFKFDSDEQIALAYLDCDYYSSTRTCLKFLDGKLKHGCLLAFDDWDCYYSDPKRGQKKAFYEFVELTSNRYHFEEFCDISSGGRCFVVLEKEKLGSEVLQLFYCKMESTLNLCQLLPEQIEKANPRRELTTEEIKRLNKLEGIADKLKHGENVQQRIV